MSEYYTLEKSVLMVVEGEKITARFNGRFFNLEGEDVTEVLIPVLDYLKRGTTLEEMRQILPLNKHEKLESVIGTLMDRGWINNCVESHEENKLLKNYSSIGIKIEELRHILNGKKIGIITLSSEKEIFERFNYKNMFVVGVMTIEREIQAEEIEKFISTNDFIVVYQQEENIKIENIINSIAYKLEKPYIYLTCSGFVSEIGPMVIPPYTACRNCYRVRKSNNLNHFMEAKVVEEYLEKATSLVQTEAYSVDPFAEYMAVCIVYNQIVQYFVKDCTWNFPRLIENVLEIDTFNCTFSISSLLKMPRCKVCGNSLYKVVPTKFWTKPINYQGE